MRKEKRMGNTEVKEVQPLAEPYRKKIGRVTFQVSSFGNDKSNETAQQLILRMLADQVVRTEIKNFK